MSHVHFIGGEKGGVGKSVMARVLAQWMIDSGQPFAAIDADRSHAALARYYGDFTQRVVLAEPDSADQIMDRALAGERRVLVDLPAQSAHEFEAWLNDADVVGFARDIGVRLSYWHVSDGGFASVEELARTLAALNSFNHVLVRNRGRSKDFSQLEASPAWSELLAQNGVVIDLPELEASCMYKIDRSGSSFWAATNHDGPDGLGPLERRRTRLWMERAYAELDRIQERL